MSLSDERSLVLSGGGPPGAAWMIEGLRAGGVDLGESDLIVGTSAGAIAGAQLASGMLERVVAMYRADEFPRVTVPVATDEFIAAAVRADAEASDRDEGMRRIANLEPLAGELVSEDALTELFEALVPLTAWPKKRLAVTAVDAQSGRRVSFDAGSGVGLLDAVRASCGCSEVAAKRFADQLRLQPDQAPKESRELNPR